MYASSSQRKAKLEYPARHSTSAEVSKAIPESGAETGKPIDYAAEIMKMLESM